MRHPLCADIDGLSPQAPVRVEAHECKRLEQLYRYIARPPLSHARAQIDAGAHVQLKLETPWRDGIARSVMSPMEFMQRLAALAIAIRAREAMTGPRFRAMIASPAARRRRARPHENRPCR